MKLIAKWYTKFRLWLLEQLFHRVIMQRKADLIIGQLGDEYLQRWFLIPRNPICNVYLHLFGRSDDARALHDHPWLFNASWVLDGEYIEHQVLAGGIHKATHLREGQFRFRFGPAPHRLELMKFRKEGATSLGLEDVFREPELAVVTLFVTGPVVRSWGFHCKSGWIKHTDWKDENGCGEVRQ